MTNLASLLACPRCGARLDASSCGAGDDLRCGACQVTFPRHGGIPWLFADPEAAVSDWRNRWNRAVEHLRRDLSRVDAALAADDLPETTRLRLTTLAAGYRAQLTHLRTVLAPIAQARGGSLETLLALRTRLPAGHGIFSYEANVHRDWCWGAEECEAALQAVLEALDDHPTGRVLVLGAGAGRLAYDLHQHTSAVVTIAADLNPLLVYAGARVCAGETLELVEFPLAPRGPSSVALPRTLAAPAPARPGLEFVMADALLPPFQPECFDVVVTPWLLDVVQTSATAALGRINPLLADGGIWINQGSVAFDGPDPAERLTVDELLEVAERAGFEAAVASDRAMPYMNGPDSRHGRTEWVVTLRGRKRRTVAAAGRHAHLPEWIVSGRAPIPALPAFSAQAMTTRMHAFIMSLIDGRRSLDDIARVLEEQRLLSRQDARTALRGFLTTMFDEAQRGGRPPI